MDIESGAVSTTPPYSSEGGATRALSQLIAIAGAALEMNPNIALDCILRATSLLQSKLNGPDVGSAARRGGLAPWQARRVSSHISANLRARIRVQDLAGLLQVSPGHFCRAFRETFGEPPVSYIMSRRIHRAQELMIRSHEPLAHIALECGLSDQSHFTRVFRRVVGTTPSTWRRQHAIPRS
jgi:AraC family transcriptional regulator